MENFGPGFFSNLQIILLCVCYYYLARCTKTVIKISLSYTRVYCNLNEDLDEFG